MSWTNVGGRTVRTRAHQVQARFFRDGAGDGPNGSGLIRIVEDRGRRVVLEASLPAKEWTDFYFSDPKQISFVGSGDEGRRSWHSDALIVETWEPEGELARLSMMFPELREDTATEGGSGQGDVALASAELSRGCLLPAPPDNFEFLNQIQKAVLVPGIPNIELEAHPYRLEVGTYHGTYGHAGDVAGLIVEESVIAGLKGPLDADPAHEAGRQRALDDLRRCADDLQSALTLLSAQFIRWTRLNVLQAAGGRIHDSCVHRSIEPPAKLPGTDSVVRSHALAIALPLVFKRLRDGGDADVIRATIDQFAGACSAALIVDRLRHAVVALDLLAYNFGNPAICSRSELKSYVSGLEKALQDNGVPDQLVQRLRRSARSLWRNDFETAIGTAMSSLGVPFDDLFPDGFHQVVRVRNDLQHRGYVRQETAPLAVWSAMAPNLAVLVARGLLRACNVPVERDRDVWPGGVVRPAGW